MDVYYLDEPLNDEDLEHARTAVAEMENGERVDLTHQIRINSPFPSTLNAPETTDDAAAEIDELIASLESIGLRRDSNEKVLFVMPKEGMLAARYLYGIWMVTGVGPYVAHRWRREPTGYVRQEVQISDMDNIRK